MRPDSSAKEYFFIDIDLYSRQIVSWGTDAKAQITMNPKNGAYRVFLSRGQYNKLVAKLELART